MSAEPKKEPRKPRGPLLTGWCNPSHTDLTNWAHRRCYGGQNSNPDREWQPCPCPCHQASVEDQLAELL